MVTIKLTPSEERLAQLLTRDAWTYFSGLIAQREIFHVKDIPMMPRGGSIELPADLEVAQYYVDFAERYSQKMVTMYGFTPEDAKSAFEGFVGKIEGSTGVRRGMGDQKIQVA